MILCRTQADAEAALALAQAWTQQHGLRLHPEKSRIVESRQASFASGFDCLGYRFAGGRRYVRPKSLKALRDKIRQKTGRTRSGSLDLIIAELNPTLRGWFGYFKHATAIPFVRSTALYVDDFGRSYASLRNAQAMVEPIETINAGQLHSSRHMGFSPFMKPVGK